MKTNLFALTLLTAACALAQSPPQAPQHPPNGYPDAITRSNPWGQLTVKECYPQYVYGIGAGGAIGLRVSATISPLATTGYHGHNGPGRPAGSLASYLPYDPQDPHYTRGYAITDAVSGCVTFTFNLPGYAGWYLVEFTAGDQAPCGCAVNPVYFGVKRGRNYYAGVTDWLPTNLGDMLAGNLVSAEVMVAPSGASLLQQPPFHSGPAEHSGQSKWMTRSAKKDIAYLATKFKEHYPTSPLDLIRAALPDGGNHDLHLPFTGFPYLQSEWWTYPREKHWQGNEADFSNLGPSKYDTFEQLVILIGCKMGQADPSGNMVTSTGPNSFWRNGSWWHVTCGESVLQTVQ